MATMDTQTCAVIHTLPVPLLPLRLYTDYPIPSTYNDKISAYVTRNQQFMEYTQNQQHFSKDEVPRM
jgi:hypothetical protein